MQVNKINPFKLPSLPLEMRSQLPKVAGIYFVFNRRKQVQYIGRSANIRQRWINHHKHSDLRDVGITIAWLKLDSTPQIRAEIETALINLYKPPLNRIPLIKATSSKSKPTKFSKAFEKVMSRYKLSGAELAGISGLSAAQVSRFRNGGNLRIDSLEKLLWALPIEAYNYFFKLLKSSL